MDPQIALNRGYWEDAGECRDQWITAYKEIAKKHWHHKKEAKQMIERIERACSLAVTHAVHFDTGNVDDCFLGERIAAENEFLEKTEKARKRLEGKFPCGNEDDMRFARHFFSIRELAYIQMGFASEVDPDDLSQMPPFDKPYSDEALVTPVSAADQPLGRRGFLHECLGRYEEAIACYEAIGDGRPDDRIKQLRKKLFIVPLNESIKLNVLHFHNSFWSQSDIQEFHDYSAISLDDPKMTKCFAWLEWDMRFSGAFESLERHFIGIVNSKFERNDDLDSEVPTLSCGVKYELRGSSDAAYIYEVGDPDIDLLIEKDKEGNVTFCGMQRNGKRHGLGSEFQYDGDELTEFQGLWQNGKLTHKVEEYQLIPVEP